MTVRFFSIFLMFWQGIFYLLILWLRFWHWYLWMRLVLVIFSLRVSYEEHIVGFCLVCLGCYNKNARGWMAYKQQKVISHSFEGRKPKIRAPAWLGSCEGPLADCRLLTSHLVLSGASLRRLGLQHKNFAMGRYKHSDHSTFPFLQSSQRLFREKNLYHVVTLGLFAVGQLFHSIKPFISLLTDLLLYIDCAWLFLLNWTWEVLRLKQIKFLYSFIPLMEDKEYFWLHSLFSFPFYSNSYVLKFFSA